MIEKNVTFSPTVKYPVEAKVVQKIFYLYLCVVFQLFAAIFVKVIKTKNFKFLKKF